MTQSCTDLEHTSTAPTVGLIGFGAFGQLVARELADHCRLTICDPAYSHATLPDGRSFPLQDLSTAAQCNIVILAIPVARMSHICKKLAPHLRPGTLVVDVGSVKLAPMAVMQAELPDHVDLLGTHPLFGPQSAKQGITGCKIALCPLRGTGWRQISTFLRKRGLQVMITTAEDHDRDMAMVQGLTHLISKVITDLGPLPAHLTTASFDLLRDAIGMVQEDPPTVLHAIEVANPYARDVRRAFFARATALQAQFDEGAQTPPA